MKVRTDSEIDGKMFSSILISEAANGDSEVIA
jgi:hypothetical protein